MIAQKIEGFRRVPARMTKLKDVRARFAEPLEKRRKPRGVLLKLRWKLKQHRTSLRLQKAEATFQQGEAVAGFRAEPFPVRDEL